MISSRHSPDDIKKAAEILDRCRKLLINVNENGWTLIYSDKIMHAFLYGARILVRSCDISTSGFYGATDTVCYGPRDEQNTAAEDKLTILWADKLDDCLGSLRRYMLLDDLSTV